MRTHPKDLRERLGLGIGSVAATALCWASKSQGQEFKWAERQCPAAHGVQSWWPSVICHADGSGVLRREEILRSDWSAVEVKASALQSTFQTEKRDLFWDPP